jgi:ribosomal protein RSM22 (predicted rRNA methylase)
MKTARLPQDLRNALERAGDRIGYTAIVEASARISEAYRAGRAPRLSSPAELWAYAITRAPATYGALASVFRELPAAPASLLDLGAGPGTSLFAARDVFGEAPRATLIEQNTNWVEIAGALNLPPAMWRHADMRRLNGPLETHDAVLMSYSLNEVGDSAVSLVEQAWGAAAGALIILEPGTPAGYRRVMAARERLISLGAHILAPCPHSLPCPMEGGDWCHFAVRLERSRLHRLAKGGDLGYEDEKFSYLIALREPGGLSRRSRVLRHPWQEKNLVRLELCTPEGLKTLHVSRRDGAAHRIARKTSWGDQWAS